MIGNAVHRRAGRAMPVAALVVAALAGACGGVSAPSRTEGTPAHSDGMLLVAVGDIACPPGAGRTAAFCHHAAVARLVESLRPARIALLGDTQYPSGSASQYRGSFDPTWGRLRPRLRPAPGNHEYKTEGAEGYFGYFGALAGPRGRGYYSYDLGDWHLVTLNSNCTVVSCAPDGDQLKWLRRDLAANPSRCTLVYWHHPRFSSGYNGDHSEVASFWEALHDAGADVVLVGHDHHYERFALQDPDGRADPDRGIRQFVVGTGGQLLRPLRETKPNSERRNADTFGVLALSLHHDRYSWRFVPEPGSTFTDAGSGRCR